MKNLMKMYGNRIKRKDTVHMSTVGLLGLDVLKQSLSKRCRQQIDFTHHIDLYSSPVAKKIYIGTPYYICEVFMEVIVPHIDSGIGIEVVAEVNFEGVYWRHSIHWEAKSLAVHLINATFPDGKCGYVTTWGSSVVASLHTVEIIPYS